MFELILLAAAVAGIASLARGRGGNPLVWGSIAVASFVIGTLAGRQFWAGTVAQVFLPWALVGLVALEVRFILGAGRPKPDSMWSCPDCSMVNESNYVVCQACRRPWSPAPPA